MGIKNTIGSKGFISSQVSGPSSTVFEPGFSRRLTGMFFVDKNSTSEYEDGSMQSPYKTIQAATNAALSGSGDATIYVAAGQYDENVTVNMASFSANLFYLAQGGVSIGTYNGTTVVTSKTFTVTGSASSSPNIIFKSNQLSSFPGSAGFTKPGWRISNRITFNHSGTVFFQFDGEIGTTNTISMENLGGLSSLIVSHINSSRIYGGITGSFWMVENDKTLFSGDIDVYRMDRMESCVLDTNNSIRVDVGQSGLGNFGFYSTEFRTGSSFSGPSGSFIVDAATNYWVVNNSVAITGSKVLIHSEA